MNKYSETHTNNLLPMATLDMVEALILGYGVGSYVFQDDSYATALLDNSVIFPAL